MTTPRSSAAWYETGEQAKACLELALELVRQAAGLDLIGGGGGAQLPRRLVLVCEGLERVIETSDRQYQFQREKEEREARLAQLKADRLKAQEATYGRRL